MYDSPIDVIYKDVEMKFENDVMTAVQSYGIYVDKDELIKALQYDRGQYEKAAIREGLSIGGKLMDSLKPCPFCGSKVDIVFHVQDTPFTCFDYFYFVECYKCDFKIVQNVSKLPELDPEQAAKAKNNLKMRWNRRVNDEQ